MVSCQNEKSQLQNREQAMRILRARLLAAAEEEASAEASDARRSQVRTVDRSERIRTYNFAENRISDHRTGYKSYDLDRVLDGDLDAVIASCVEADMADAARVDRVSDGEPRPCCSGTAERRLAEAGVASPEYDAAELLAHVLGTTGAVGPGHLRRDVRRSAARFEALVDAGGPAASRCSTSPVAAAFRHVELAVGPGVFVPRQETELLAGWAVERAREASRTPVVVDLCTGSGAIAAQSRDEVPAARVHAVELDPGAHAWAERNLAGTGVDLRLGDMADAFPDLDGTVDVVTCNPPYIPLEAWVSVAPEARDHDPATALWSGDDGLDAMRVLERTAARLLRPGGWVGAEHADVQGESAPRGLHRDRSLARGARPPRPGRSCALPDRTAGTMTA